VINLLGDSGEPFEHLFMLRLEPEGYQVDVAYHPHPQTLEAWQSETDALIVLNGGYFREEGGAYVPNGLTVVGGEAIGNTYGEFAGMFVVTSDGPDLRWLAQEPYDPSEPLLAALQSFPVLVRPGGVLGFTEQDEDHRAARRTVIAQDRDGRVLFIVASRGNFTLHALSAYLVASDLELDIAINLDGGPSSGMLLASPWEEVPALAPLPVVITVLDR
jgi:exopolysaccharide biosynthesis protein